MGAIERVVVADQDYPGTWTQFLEWFGDEASCARYLERLRWPSGFACGRCGTQAEPYRASRGRLVCRACRHQSSVTAGTLLDKTRLPLRVWLAAIWYVTSQKHGVSALGLQRVLGLGSYQTAWTLLHRLRRAMVRVGRERLSGRVEVDETLLALGDRHVPFIRSGRKTEHRRIVVAVAIELKEPKGFGRIRLKRLKGANQASLREFIWASIEPGSLVTTDGSAAYAYLDLDGYRHDRAVLLGADTAAHDALPGVHRIAALLKRWLLGIHHGAVQPQQLDHYLDEFVFRFNRRASATRGLLFYRLLTQALEADPVTYAHVAGLSSPDP
jgi:transposase-like protein